MKFKRIELPYSYEALEPVIDKKTVEIHYEKHHATYEAKFNELAKGTMVEKFDNIEEVMKKFDSIPKSLQTFVKNHGGGLINHNIYWEQFTADRNLTKEEVGYLDLIIQSFGTKDKFVEDFINAGLSQFGSGWVWAIIKDGKVEITTTPNQENPYMYGADDIIIGIDVWEHAYYLKYQQDRKTYIENALNLTLVAN